MAFRSVASVLAGGLLALGAAACGSPAEESDSTAESTPQSAAQSTPGADAPKESAETGQSSGSADAEPVVITIKDFEFAGPASVAPGATVTVVNEDRSSHTVTSEAGDFEEVVVKGGADGSFVAPSRPGEYAYVCDFHPEMTATLVVK